jgi:hypothetical protein
MWVCSSRYGSPTMWTRECGGGCLSLSPLRRVSFWCRQERGHPGQSIRAGALFARALSAFHVSDPITAAYCTCNRVLVLIDFWSGDPQDQRAGNLLFFPSTPPPALGESLSRCIFTTYSSIYFNWKTYSTSIVAGASSAPDALHPRFSLVTDRIVVPLPCPAPSGCKPPPRTLSAHFTF